MSRQLSRAEQDAILAANGITNIEDDEFVVFEGEEFTIYKLNLIPKLNRRQRRALRAAERQGGRHE
ncbi:hypothetical protein BQ8794_10024 [Mesorhizobium prunaredense]|uniref:Uncharacterized protein n=1 Tax=Mesorhizobium prunaredense TaxID=1631249 RepID=A0A1R3V0A2_9HYPH|nr:hypothetical protein [Mesorhizobium prunaredense]SIT52654.1 hypothetical protein BQ8794_10024 [Mesorhizobium prunaredense]